MTKKRTKLLLFLLTLTVIVAMIGMIACTDGGTDEPDEPDKPGIVDDNAMTFGQYMNKINAGLKASESAISEAVDYHVSSEYTVYTREENLTVKYEAIYRENRRDGIYHIRIFDNNNHLERLNAYYDSSDLYVTVKEEHYAIEDFGTLLIFDTFSAFLDLLDLGEFVYGKEMQTYFSETTVLSSIVGVKNLGYVKTGENKERVTVADVDMGIIMGQINAQVAAWKNRIGNAFDAVTDHYLGFSFSRILEMEFRSIEVKNVDFNIESGRIGSTEMGVSGRMGDNTPYLVSASYAYDETTTEIKEAKSLPTDYVYAPVTPGRGAFAGKTTLPTMRDSDFDFSLDYNLNAVNNADNEFTVRVYDQLSTSDSLNASNKYDNISEIVSAYYYDETLFVNTEGAYDYIGTTIALNALRLPKVYFSGLNVTGVMSLAYTDLLQILSLITTPPEQTGTVNDRLIDSVIAAIESDVANKEIRITVTEALIKQIRGDDTDLAVLLGETLGVDSETILRYFGNDFFQLLSVVIRYNFGTGILGIDVYNGTELVMSTDMENVGYNGITLPHDLNELNYTEFKEPEIITVTYDIELNPYGAETVSVSEFIGAFVGDATGINTPYILSTGQYLSVRGRMSEYYVSDANGERKPVTTMDLRFVSVNKGTGEETLIMTLTTNPFDLGQLLVGLYSAIGDYDGADGGIKYVIDREKVAEQLENLTEGENIFSGNTGLSAFLSIYNAAEKNAKTYTDDGYFCVDLTVSDKKDPVSELIGIEDTNARIKCKIGFDVLDLSAVDADSYSDPFVHIPEDVSATSIYSDGSKWKETAVVTVSGKRITLKPTYREDSIKIETGKNDYNPVAEIFGKEFGYALHIVSVTGTYKVKSVSLSGDMLIIDPAFSSSLPAEIEVMFEGGETGKLACSIEGFPDSRVTPDGYNLPLLAGVTEGMEKYRLTIGRNSIASIEKDVYIAVINRRVKAKEDSSGNDMIYVTGSEQIPVVAEYDADPYTYAMTKRLRAEEGAEYDYLTEQLNLNRDTVQFENLYGYEKAIDDKTGEEVLVPLYYDAEGYNWFYLHTAGLEWNMSDEAFSWRGETRYAVATYGDEANGYAVKIAIKINVRSKIVRGVRIDSAAEGAYTVDYLKEETYVIPTSTTGEHTVRVYFEDDTSRIVSLTRPAILGDDEYCAAYVYGELLWADADGIGERLEEQGTNGLFTTGTGTTNVTTAAFGGEICDDSQTVSLNVIAPSRAMSAKDTVSMSLVTEIEEDGTMHTPIPVTVSKAQFEKPSVSDDEIKPFGINPYNKQACLPDTIWLYVPVTMDENGRKEWTEYPVEWLTTGKPGSADAAKELNIIKLNDNGKYVLAHPVTQETKLVVYGIVGNAYNHKITVTMSLLNMASDIKNYELYLSDGSVFDKNESASVDPYLDYSSAIPSSFSAVLGSGQTVEGATDWYYGEYPIIRSGRYLAAEYDGMYSENGYYIFPREGGQFSLEMTVAEGEVRNQLYLEVRVDSRDVYAKYEVSGGTVVRISDYVDIFATGRTDGEVYAGEPSPGYTNINYYTAYSSVFLRRIEQLIAAGGVGVAGFAFEQTGLNNLYAKKVVWNTGVLAAIAQGLKKPNSGRTFTLGGTIDYGTVNETTVTVLVTIDEMTASLVDVGLTKSEDMRLKEVYTIANDLDSDGRISLTAGGEGKKLVDAAYYRNEQYKQYFGSSEGYTDLDFANVIYFEIDKIHMLSAYANGLYTSPYDYFVYLFDNIELKFTSEKTVKATAKNAINLGNRNAEYFNSCLLGLNEDMIYRDESGRAICYAFLILEKLSEGSATDRTLVIVSANKANATELQREDEIDALNEDLTELYPERFELPGVIEVVYEKEDGTGSYTARYAVDAWTPTLKSYFGSFDPISAIEARYINIIDGSSYGFSFELPDMASADNLIKTFYYTVEFRKKNVMSVNYDASARSSVYDIDGGKIYVVNSYAFLTKDVNAEIGKEYVFNTEAVPTVLGMRTTTGAFQAGANDNYRVRWTFTENAAFGEEIFAKGTVKADGSNPGVLIATYTFDSYYDRAGNHLTQTLELYLVLEPMEFYAIESDELKIIAGNDEGENEKLNTIEIDPYGDTGYNGNFILPTTITLIFNGTRKYTFGGATYMLTDEKGTPMREISNIPYGEKGHKLTYDYTPDPSELKLMLYVRGYSRDLGTGIRINIKFLKRTITDSKIPNATYGDDGTFAYETDSSGNTVMENGEPKKKIYYAYADYAFAYELNGDELSVSGKMPVYYIDPYNSATFALPTKAAFEFAETAPGVYVEYNITGWQYYNVETRSYRDFTTIADGDEPGAKDRFYQTLSSDGKNYRCYFKPSADSYKGAYYPLRGYISVGDESQYFEIICVVLNRSLRTSAILRDEYTVSYDFADPIAAMLQDIPAMLGADAFVDYDRYNDKFTVSAKRGSSEGVYTFMIGEDGQFSRKVSGTATNFAVVPELLWDEEYDTDGDGVPDTLFDELTTKGFTGTIGGNLYYGDGNLNALFDYYGIKVNYDYDRLVAALMWDTLFAADGSVSNAFSSSARNAIEKESALLEQQVVHAAYDIILAVTGTEEEIAAGKALSEENKQALGTSIFETVLQEMNREAQISGAGDYDPNDAEDMIYIAYRIYLNVKEEYDAWSVSRGEKTAKAEIYEVWAYNIADYRRQDVTASRQISGNQSFKAEHFLKIFNTDGTLNTEEKNRLSSAMTTLRAGLYISINVDLWQEVYDNANPSERAVMDGYAARNLTTGNPSLGLSIACDLFKADKDDLTGLGTKGEGASADISIPLINFDSITVEGADTNIIRFNKFNFASVDKAFSVRFELSYEEIYQKMIDEARENAIKNFRDDKKSDSLTEFAEKAIREAVDGIAPKEKNADGEYEVIDGMKYGSSSFGYDMWIAGNRKSSYASFWNALLTYRYDDAVKVITANVASLGCYADFANDFVVSSAEAAAVEAALRMIKVPAMAEAIIANIEKEYDFDSAAGRRAGVRAAAEYVYIGNASVTTMYEAYEAIGLDGNYALDNAYDVTETIWNTVVKTFVNTAFPQIAEQKIAQIEANYPMDAASGRRDAVRAFAEYLVEEDALIKRLNAIYDKAEGEKRATLATVLLAGNSADANIQNAVAEAGDGNRELGYAVLFDHAYDEIVDLMYAFIAATPGVGDGVEFETLVNTYESNPRMKGIISYFCMVSSDSALSKAANTYFVFLTDYAKGKTSPYDKLLENPTPSGYTAEQLEKFVGGELSGDCLLYYAKPTEAFFNAIKANASGLGMTEAEIALALGRMTLYNVVYDKASTANKNLMDAMATEARAPGRTQAMNKMFAKVNDSIAGNLEKYYNNDTNVTNNLAYYSFVALVEEAIGEGTEKGTAYEKYEAEYIADNEYIYSFDLLGELKKKYEESKTLQSGSLTSVGFIANEIYAKYFENPGYLTITEYGDDAYDENYLLSELEKTIERKGMAAVDYEKTVTGYMKDTLLRALAYYYDNVADESQKDVVAEVSEMYIGVAVGGDLERAYIIAANSGRAAGSIGINIYRDLLDRNDLGTGAAAAIDACYYTVWLNTIIGGAEKTISEYPQSGMAGKVPFTTNKIAVGRVINAISGESESAEITGEAADAADKIAAGITRKAMKDSAMSCIGYTDAYEATVRAKLAAAAKNYAYDGMYDEKTERGVYAYRDELDDILAQLVGSGSELDELTFNETQRAELDDKLSTMEDAVFKAVKTVFYSEIYDKIKLLGLSAEEFAARAYTFVTGETAVDAAIELFGEEKNGTGGIVAAIVNEFIVNNGVLIENGTNAGYVERLKEWWKTGAIPEENTMYGKLGDEEQEILAQVHKQAYYQTNDLTSSASLTLEARNQIAYASMLTGLYLFLRDKENEISAMPADYFSAGNEDEYKAYVIGLMLEGDLMKNSAHSLSLAQAKLSALCASLAYQKAMKFAEMTGEGALEASDVTTDAYLAKISKAIIRANTVIPSSVEGDTTADREKIFYRYLEKAVSYVEYTSVLGSEDYDRGADIRVVNPLRKYADAKYIAITGYDMRGVSYIDGESTETFGMTSFGKLLANAGGNYTQALASISDSRLVTANDFVSEDHATAGDRHVIYFDRAEWDKYLTESGDYDANAYYSNRNVFIANPGKTERITDVSGGYGYTNAIKATGFEYRLSDFTTLDLFFGTDESNPYDEAKANLLMLDALSPELPDEAYAIGYVTAGAGVEYGIRLGKIGITEYSDEFYKLVYKATEPVEDSAYSITLKTASGYVYKKIGGIKVGYLDRNVEKIYLETGAYTEGKARPETSGDFVNLYSIYDSSATGATAGKNVIYIDPTDEELLLTEKKQYVLPGTVAIQCGEGEKVVFTEVEWDTSKVTYGLKGTGAAGIALKVNSYKYVDADGNTRHIKYNFTANKVVMDVYDKDNGQLVSSAEYILSADDMIEWNTVLRVGDQSLQSVSELSEEGSYELLATVGADGIADATTLGAKINPYYPVYPTQLQLGLAGDNKIIELTQEDWTPDLTKLNAIKRGDVSGDRNFTAAFNYLGYEIRLRFCAMDITMPKGTVFDGGTIYLVKGEGDVKTQFEKNYGTAYFNFNEDPEGAPDWQKVPVSLKNYNDVRISEEGVQVVEGIIGGTGIGDMDANATFRVQVVSLKNFALLDGEFNLYSVYDYYSVPSDGNKKANGSGDSPAEMGETYIFIDKDGERRYFTASNADLEYDFINKKVTVSVTYDLDEETDARISYNAYGDRKRGFTFTAEMKNYERSGVSDPTFDTDDTDKIWKWTDVPKTSAKYTDAIYWPIGRDIKASDLPTVTDKTSGMTFNLMWDLSGLNVNRANVSVPGEVNNGDGTVIYGYYMLKNGVWQALALTVYIEKIDVTDAVVGFVKADGTVNTAKYLEKTYDAQYYTLPFDAEADGMKFLRDDGTKQVIPSERYVVEYCAEADADYREWSTTRLPLDAGYYYIRVRFVEDDYNVYIAYTDGWLFRLYVRPYTVDMSGLRFENEDEETSTITQVYGATNAYLNVISGLPSFTPANWFTPGEKEYLFNEYRKTYSTDERAKAEVYRNVYARVSDNMREIIDGWYSEGLSILSGTAGFAGLSESERDVAVRAWIYDNKMETDLKVVEAKIVINYYYDSQLLEFAPTDCGNYTVEILLDASDGNYVAGDKAKNLILRIEKDSGLNYSIANTNLIYNGRAQNPEISGLHKNGTVPYGVRITYLYMIGNKTLVVIAEGIKDEKGNVINKVSIDASRTTVDNPMSGLKDAGSYICSVEIDGGKNYLSGTINDVAIGISPANVYINLDEVNKKYLSEVADLSDYLRVYDRNGTLQSSGILLGTDKLSDLGVAALSTPVGRHYKVGTYYTFIDGFKTSDAAAYVYTELSGTEIAFNGETYTLLALKGYESEGSLYRDENSNAALIRMFGNYNLFVRTHEYTVGVKASGKYRIEQEDGSDGVSGNAELAAYIASIKDNDVKTVYLAPITDSNGEPIAYDPITINVAANITIVGYRSNAGSESEAEIETRIKGIRILKGTVTLKIVSLEASANGQTAVYVGDGAGYVTITESRVVKAVDSAENTVGISTSVNYKERLYLSGVTFEGLSLALELVGGELEIEQSTFVRNYNGIAIRMESPSVSIKSSVFSNTTKVAVSSVSDRLTVRNNRFEYNGTSLSLPEGSPIRTNVNNNNVYENNGDDALYE